MLRDVLVLLVPAALLCGCPQPSASDDDDEPTPPEHPDVVETAWIGDLTGTITYEKRFRSGDLDGQTCTETFTLTGSPLTSVPQECAACDIVHQVFVTQVDDCPGGDDLEESGQAGFDLRQIEGEAVMWWFFQGWFGSDWSELGTGTLTQDWDGSVLRFDFPFADPNNGNDFGGNAAWGEGCFPCLWDGDYQFTFDFAFELPADWWEQQQAAE